eukprot:TRINITY_DN18369_c0_g1_i1.p2 TRINITY_DN18369_c0_g1~~TRINITY_DN18369_c0_g1_i1.p2  ORF type:complete len:184 (+),score=44.81 TRINITY_DN18369_c0_g1_i1:65-553(+)
MPRRGAKSDRIEVLDSETEEVGGRVEDKQSPKRPGAGVSAPPPAAAAAAGGTGAGDDEAAPLFRRSFVDFLMYITVLFAGLWCLFLGATSPRFGVGRCAQMKFPTSSDKVLRYLMWWLLALGSIVCGGVSTLFGALGVVNATMGTVKELFANATPAQKAKKE